MDIIFHFSAALFVDECKKWTYPSFNKTKRYISAHEYFTFLALDKHICFFFNIFLNIFR